MNTVQRPVALDQTVGTITTGQNPDPVAQPVFVLGADELALLRAHQHMLRTLQLEPEWFCLNCYDGTRDSKSVIEINNQQIVIACGCRMLYGQGPSDPLPTFPILEQGGSALIHSVIVPIVELSALHAQMFRRMKAFFEKYRIGQALRCRTCFSRNLPDGTDGVRVTGTSVVLECRHRRLRAVGTDVA